MKQLALKVTTVSPLSIRSDHSPTGASVAPYIPGSTLMGCLASVHRMLHGDQDEQFSAFFLSDKVLYPNLYPASFKNDDMREAFSPIYCIPRTAQTCKRFKGFLPLSDDNIDDEDEAHGVRDSLFDWAQFALLNKAERIATDEEIWHIISSLQEKPGSSRTCTCGESLDSYNGFYRWDEEGMRAIARSSTRLITRTGINRKFGVVEEQILYNREVYEEDNPFFGVIQVEDNIASALQDFIWEKETEDSPLLLDEFARFGTARTRGFGQVAFALRSLPEEEDRFELFKERLQFFNNALRDRVTVALPQPFYFAITLHAPTILSDELLRYAGTISEKQLASLTGFTANTFKLLYHSASMRRIMGWQDLWGLPRMHEYALEAGSVFLFAVTQPLDDKLAQALFTLEELGIGQRRAEGFGRICISDPFHREGALK